MPFVPGGRAIVTVEPMRAKHVAEVAAIHAGELGGDLLPALGIRFLERTFYPAHLDDPDFVVFVATSNSDSRVLGFVVTAAKPKKYSVWMIRRTRAGLLLATVKLALTRPRRLLEGLIAALQGHPELEDVGEIAFIAVDRAVQGRGIGPQLVDAANDYFRARRLRRACTKTLASNAHVVRMYSRRWAAEQVSSVRILDKAYVYLAWNVSRD